MDYINQQPDIYRSTSNLYIHLFTTANLSMCVLRSDASAGGLPAVDGSFAIRHPTSPGGAALD